MEHGQHNSHNHGASTSEAPAKRPRRSPRASSKPPAAFIPEWHATALQGHHHQARAAQSAHSLSCPLGRDTKVVASEQGPVAGMRLGFARPQQLPWQTQPPLQLPPQPQLQPPMQQPHPIVQKRPRGRPPKRPLSGRSTSSNLSESLASEAKRRPSVMRGAAPQCTGMRYLPPALAQDKPMSAIQAAPFCPGSRHAGFSCPPEHPLAQYSPADVVDWLRTTAATLTGHGSAWLHAAQPTVGTSAAEEWQHQEVLLRIRIATHEEQQEIAFALGEELGGVRRSARSRAAPDVYKPPADLGRSLQNLRALQRLDDEPREVRQGEEYQAVSIPEVRPRPKKLTGEEAARLAAQPILQPGSCGPAGQPAPLHTHPLPPELHASFGIGAMGFADASDWTAEEQAQFEEGLRENDRDFVETVKMGILTSKPIARQVGYYYNVWKTLSTGRARLWYYNLNEEKEDDKLEELKLEGRRNAEAARRYQQLAVLLRRKRLGEGMRWLRQAATAPHAEHPIMEPARKRIRATQVSWADGHVWRALGLPPRPPLAKLSCQSFSLRSLAAVGGMSIGQVQEVMQQRGIRMPMPPQVDTRPSTASPQQQAKPSSQGVGLLAQVRTAAHSDRAIQPGQDGAAALDPEAGVQTAAAGGRGSLLPAMKSAAAAAAVLGGRPDECPAGPFSSGPQSSEDPHQREPAEVGAGANGQPAQGKPRARGRGRPPRQPKAAKPSPEPVRPRSRRKAPHAAPVLGSDDGHTVDTQTNEVAQ